jgi:Signal transduction histidine kinase
MSSKKQKMKINEFRFTKISVKLTLIYAFLFSCVLLLLNASVLYGVKYYLHFQSNKQVEDIGSILTSKVYESDNILNGLTDKDFFEGISTNGNIYFKIMDNKGNILNVSEMFKYTVPFKEPYGRSMYMEVHGKHITYENIELNRGGYTLYIQVIKDMDNEYDFLKILFILMAAADAIGILLSIGTGFILSKRMLKPIDNITKTAQSISINNLKNRIDVKGPDDELKSLADTFNDMIDRLQDSFERQVQFVSDASHELRTPISVIQGYADLLDRWGKDDRMVLDESVTAIKNEAASMASLIEKLLFLARGDSGTQRMDKEDFQLDELINEVVKESRLITDKYKIINTKNDSLLIHADRKMIKQMLRIFIDNSIKFTPEQGDIRIDSVNMESEAKITVEDTGAGIPKEDIPKIFNRFYRVDKARAKGTGGSGLGLSIAKWIVDAHKGRIIVESSVGKGTKIDVFIPVK